MKLLENKKALITGAALGIGRAIALAYAAEGADVAFTDIRLDDDTESLVKEIEALGVRGKAYASDASNFEQSDTLIDEVVKDFGTIDILVNNAGITRDNLLMRMAETDWDLVIKVNLKSVFNSVSIQIKCISLANLLASCQISKSSKRVIVAILFCLLFLRLKLPIDSSYTTLNLKL